MPGHIDVNDKDASLRALSEQVSRGEEVVLVRDGRVVAKIVAHTAPTPEEEGAERERLAALRRTAFGMYAGKIRIADDAFESDQELIESFYADNVFPPVEPSKPDPGETR